MGGGLVLPDRKGRQAARTCDELGKKKKKKKEREIVAVPRVDKGRKEDG